MKLLFNLCAFLLHLSSFYVRGEDSFASEDCQAWAESGECDVNPDWMREHCELACQEQEELARKDMEAISQIQSFYDLKAKDIDGNEVDFVDLKGKVVVITNVASYCGFTAQHYRELVQLYHDVKDTEMLEIMAFPCNQFGQQEPEECPVIKKFAQQKGVEFRMMDKVDVNGKDAHVVYKYLKNVSGTKTIRWNFATYFLIDSEGNVQSHSGTTPLELYDPVMKLIDRDEL